MEAQNNKTGYYSAILFVVWPLLALVAAFKNYKSSWARNILWAFIAFYGFVFAIGAENQGADIVRYLAEYQNLHQETMTLASARAYFVESGEVDIARTLISVIVSRFSDNQAVLTLVYGIIFGFFFSRNMWFVLERLSGKLKPITLILFACFFLVVPIWNMNGFRMWTAAHIYIYGLLLFLFENNKKGLLVSSLAVFVHFAFIIPVGSLCAYVLMGNRVVLYFGFFLATFFISEINLTVFNNIVENYAPEIVQERTAGYRGETYVQSYRQGDQNNNRVWYARWYGKALKWGVMGFLVVLFLKERTAISEKKKWLRLFNFTLLFYGIANLFNSLPSGGRFIAIANLCALALIILYIQNRDQSIAMVRFARAAMPALILYIIVAFRMGLYSMSATAILGNPLIALFLNGEHISMNDVLKMIT